MYGSLFIRIKLDFLDVDERINSWSQQVTSDFYSSQQKDENFIVIIENINQN